VYVQLDYTPWIYRIQLLENTYLMLNTHTGLLDWPVSIFQDEEGRVLIQGQQGIGLLHSHDMSLFSMGLTESNFGLEHRAQWTVPDIDPDLLIETRTRLRRDKVTPTGTCKHCFVIQAVESIRLADIFKFNPNPQVN
jgi:hypothetical protein